MVVTIIGTGFVGVVTAAVLAKFGNTVYGLDIDENKVASLKTGTVPFYEPGLEELVRQGLKSGNLDFTTDYDVAVPVSDVVMIAVGTPSAEDGTADLKFVLSAAQSAAEHLKDDAIVVVKSTVPPGTNEEVLEAIRAHTSVPFHVVSVPEFLKEGTAVQDTLKPDRVVIGADDEQVIDRLLDLHKPMSGERVIVSAESAQMAKYTANAYLAQRITFINQIANLCEKNGAHINEVIDVIGKDKRIGDHYWYPGLGYGGSCFPKDVKELAAYARSVNEGDGLLVKIDELNSQRITKKLHEFADIVGGFSGKTVAVLGLSFKPNTNDMRVAPSLTTIHYLKEQGATVKAYDPEAMDEAMKHFPNTFMADDAYMTLQDADVAILLVEWEELTSLDMDKVKTLMSDSAVFIDTRNQYDPEVMKELGFRYIGIGNP